MIRRPSILVLPPLTASTVVQAVHSNENNSVFVVKEPVAPHELWNKDVASKCMRRFSKMKP